MSRNLDMPGAPGQNSGHGHVYPRPDGARARCGGTQLCRQCQADAARKDAPVDWPARFRKAADVAEREGFSETAGQIRNAAEYLETVPPHVVEAIGEALSREGQQ
jgi:hypothetical protein